MQYNRNYPSSSIISQTEDNDTTSDSDDEKRTIYCRNLSDRVSEELLCELFIQAGPVESVRIPSDKDGRSRNFGFITYVHSCSVGYALKLFDGIQLYNRILFMKANYNANNQSQLTALPPNLNTGNFRNETPKKPSFDNSLALRLGGSGMSTSSAKNNHIRFDKDLQPKKSKEIITRNPFKVDLNVLSRLNSNPVLPEEKREKFKNDKNSKKKSGNFNKNVEKYQSHNKRDKKSEKISKIACNFRERNNLHPYKKPEEKQRNSEILDKCDKSGNNIKHMNPNNRIQKRRR